MKVLIACEFSGTVREAFRALGHDTWSCDLRPAADGSPFHIQGDALAVIAQGKWDLGIAHPPCPFLTGSAEWAYGDGPYHQKVKPGTLVGEARREARREAADFFMAFWNCQIPRMAIENPVGCMSSRFRKPDQIIQPYQFGSDASKKTCLWLWGLPILTPTERVAGRMAEWPKGSGKMVERWANQTDSGQNRLSPSDEREAIRSITYPGIAAAMAIQWGGVSEA